MNRIIKIGMDVHSKSFTLCALEATFMGEDHIFGTVKVSADYKEVIKFIDALKEKLDPHDEYDFECGYEAGCLGFTLCKQLRAAGIKCVIIAPTSIPVPAGDHVKTDIRDSRRIAECMAYYNYKEVYVLDEEDEENREFVRMRSFFNDDLKRIKQVINSFCLHQVGRYNGSYWSNAHIKWLQELPLRPGMRRVLDQYMAHYWYLTNMLEIHDGDIKELAGDSKHSGEIKNAQCLRGITTYSAATILFEVGDINRFKKGNLFAAYLGLTPGEHSSGESIHRKGITKAGNSQIRKLLVECAQSICKGKIGYKSKALKARQAGMPAEIIAYADRANRRLQSKFYRMIRKGKSRSVAVVAVARELACFIWGITTGHLDPRKVGIAV